jgi:hypothetical protein
MSEQLDRVNEALDRIIESRYDWQGTPQSDADCELVRTFINATHPIPPVDSQAAMEALDKLRKLKFESKWAVAIKDKQDAILRAFIQSRADPVSPQRGDETTVALERQKVQDMMDWLGRTVDDRNFPGHLIAWASEAEDWLSSVLTASPRPAEGWRPIETAPDETEVLIFRHDGNAPWSYGYRTIGQRDGDDWFDVDGGPITTPALWAPLLAKPVEPAKG